MDRVNISIDVDGTVTEEVIGQDILELDVPQVEEAMLNCTPKDGIDVLFDDTLRRSGYNTFIITGRQEKYRRVTSEWLDMQGILYDELVMFPNDFYEINGYVSPKYIELKVHNHIRKNIHFSLDDYQPMVDALNNCGIRSCRVADNFKDAFENVFAMR